MENAFAWLSDLILWIGNLLPHWRIVRITHAGVKFRHGKKAIEIKPGICWFWPAVTEVDIIPVARQTHNLPTQALMTRDGKKVVVSGVVVYRIKDIVKTMARNWDVADTLNDITMIAITHVITKHDFAYIMEHICDDIQDKLTKETRIKLRQYGVQVFRTALTDFCTALVIKNIGSHGGTLLATHNME